jgi:hypothetical protein
MKKNFQTTFGQLSDITPKIGEQKNGQFKPRQTTPGSKGTPNLKKKLIKRPSFLSDKENLKPIQNNCIFNPQVARIEDVLMVQPSS